jgi:hypothetical protein
MKSCFIVLTVCLSSSVFSQNYNESEKMNLIQKKGIEITKSDLNNLNDYDFDLIKNFNFDPYRNEKTDRSIQLVKGPKATIKSFQHCSLNHIPFDENVLKSKKNEIDKNTSHSIITQVNIGLGYKQNELSPENY